MRNVQKKNEHENGLKNGVHLIYNMDIQGLQQQKEKHWEKLKKILQKRGQQ